MNYKEHYGSWDGNWTIKCTDEGFEDCQGQSALKEYAIRLCQNAVNSKIEKTRNQTSKPQEKVSNEVYDIHLENAKKIQKYWQNKSDDEFYGKTFG